MSMENSIKNISRNAFLVQKNKKFISQNVDIIFHGLKHEFIEKILDQDYIEPKTYQRYWKDGFRRKENWNDYEDSYWKSGWSMTRDINVALNFGSIVFAFDKNKIKQHFKVEPFAWNYHFSDEYAININHKKEREEFVVSEYTEISIGLIEKRKKELEEKILPAMYEEYKKMAKETTEDKKARKKYKELIKKEEEFLISKSNTLLDIPRGKKLNLSENMLGFYLDDFTCAIFDGRYDGKIKIEELKFFNELKKHPKFLGLLNQEKLLEHFSEINVRKIKI